MSHHPTVQANFRHVPIPDDLRTHPWVSETWFYALPVLLLDLVRQEVRESRFDAAQLRLEQRLAETAEAIPGCVGFGDGTPICDGILRSPPELSARDSTVAAYLRECQQAGFQVDQVLSMVTEHRRTFSLPRQGYLGWLWTNPTFRAEFQQLTDQHALFSEGRPAPQPVVSPANIPHSRARRGAQERELASDLQAFCQRWRLQSVTGPATVTPLAVQVPTLLPNLQFTHAQSSGAVVYFPDIAPLPDRDELRLLLEDNTRSSARDAAHLEEWIDLVRSDTQGKKPIIKFARWYSLQHYCRVLYTRHAAPLIDCQQKLALVFSEFFSMSENTIERDLREIKRRLGTLWP